MDQGRAGTRARAVLFWGVLFFVGAQFAFNIMADRWRPGLYDPEYEVRLTTLKARMVEAPGRPLLLVLGSSRTAMNFRPEILPPLRMQSGQQPLPFNFSHLEAGPLMNLMEVRRLLANDIHPNWLVVELMPPFLANEGTRALTRTAAAGDLPLLERYIPLGRLYGFFVAHRLVPWYSHRLTLVHDFAPAWFPPQAIRELDHIRLDWLGGSTFSWMQQQLPPNEVRRRTNLTRGTYLPVLQQFQISDVTRRTIRELLDLCRREHIVVVLVLTPEGSEFRSWYPPQAEMEIGEFCRALTQTYHVPIVDARSWLADRDFTDSHHVLLRGADTFTRRLGAEVLQPLVEGRLHIQESQAGAREEALR
jgi:hypothetical protein